MDTVRNYKRTKKILLLLFTIAILFFPSCAKTEDVTLPVVAEYEAPQTVERKALKLGFVSGPYGNMFVDSIEPLLAKKGYSIELVYYEDYTQPNIALANYELDMNMFQNYKHLSSFKLEYDLALSAITEIPTAGMGLFSSHYSSLQNFSDGITVAIPNDSTNLARALQVLEAAGLIVIDPSIDKSKATIFTLSKNPYNIRFFLLEAQNIAKAIDEYDFAVINGNYALSSGLNLSMALYNETLTDGYINVIAVRTEDLNSQFVADIIDIVYSQEYRQKILQNDTYNGFQLPRNFYDTRDWGNNE